MRQRWVYLGQSGNVRIMDKNGEIHIIHYVTKRFDPGTGTIQLQLPNGRWIELD